MPGVRLLFVAATASLFLFGISGGFAQDALDQRSTPSEVSQETISETLEVPSTLEGDAPVELSAPSIGGKVTVGLNFQASQLNANLPLPGGGTFNNGFFPPDTMGAVGPHHIVLMINGEFSVFDKSTGTVIERRSLNNFWQTRVTPGQVFNAGRVFDPRIIYDPINEIFFAIAIDDDLDPDGDGTTNTPNNIFVARSDTSDPTGVWRGLSFPGDTPADNNGSPEFHDYPTLGMNADGIYICTQDFGDPGGNDESCYSIPKADVIANPPTAANLTRFVDTPTGLQAISGSWQPVVDHGLSLGRNALFGSDGSNLSHTDIFGATGPGASLGTPIGIGGDPGHATPPDARQPDDGNPADTGELIENVAPRFVGNLVVVDGFVWGVHAVLGTSGNSALRWYKIDEATVTIVDGGLIEDTDRDFHEPSIAANDRGHVVIGYSCSGPTLPVSACTSVGEIDIGTGLVVFEPPAILHTGIGVYWVDGCTPTIANPCSERNRWGDYSATVVDPSDACTFWTFQEYTAAGGTGNLGPSTDADGGGQSGQWGVRITQLTFDGCDAGDVAVTKICKPDDQLLVGEEGFCTIFVNNFGPGAAQGVQVVDEIISNGTFDIGTVTTTAGTCSATPNPQNNAGEVICDIGWLDPGDGVTITVPVSAASAQTINDLVTVSSVSADPNLDNNQDQGTITVVAPTADLRVLKDCKPDGDLLAGVTGTCTIIVDNLGPQAAANVVLTDTHVSNVAFDIDAVTGTSCVISGGVVTCNLGDMAAGASETVVVEIAEDEPQDINDITTVTSDTADPGNTNNDASDGLHIVGLADLSILKTDDLDPVIAGTQLTYVVTVANVGPSTAINVVVADVVPAGVSIDSVAATGGGVCNAGVPGNALLPTTCTFDSLASGGGSVTMTIVVTVLPDTLSVLHNDASVSSDTLDNDNSNNLATEATTVQAEADLVISKSDAPDPVVAGSTLTYTVSVANAGPSTAQDVAIVDTLPAGTSLVNASVLVGSGTCLETAPGVVTCTSDNDLAPGNTFTVVIEVLVDPSVPDGTTLTNNAVASSLTPDPVPGNNVALEDTLVNAEADLWIDKTGNFPTGNPSGTILIFLTVYNTAGCSEDDPQVCGDGGPSDALNVVVTDPLPSTAKKLPVEFVSEQCSYDKGAHTVTCTEPVLAAGDFVTFSIQVKAKGSLGEITNTASVASDTTDPDSGNNSDSLLITVQGGTGDGGGPGGNRGRGGGPKK